MKKGLSFKKKLLSMSLAICIAFGSAAVLPKSFFADTASISASAAETLYKYGDYHYRILSDGTIEIAFYHNIRDTYPAITVPASIGGKKVTSLDAVSFYSERVGSIVVPEGVKTIKSGAFKFCTATSITIPSTVTSLSLNAFNSCDNLQKVVISSANKNYSSSNGALLSKDGTKLYYVPSGVVNYTIPSGVKSIESYAVDCNKKISTLNIPDSVTTIKAFSMESSPALTTINVGAGVSLIAGYDVTGKSSSDFHYTLEKFTDINVSASNKTYASVNGVLYNKSKTKLLFCPEHKNKVTIPATASSIGNYSFSDNNALASIYIPNNVKKIEAGAFTRCTALKSAILPYGLTEVESSVFQGCKSLASISIPRGTVKVKSSAFYDCPKLSSVVIPNTVESLGSGVFTKCSALKDIYIPSSVTSIAKDTFDKSLKPVIYGKKSSQAETAAKNSGLTFRIIPETVTRYAGAGRYDTAKSISAEGIKATSKKVVLAYGLNYADALAGVPFASKIGAPILLTTKDALPEETLGEIKRLGATTVYILGGTSAIAPNVANVLNKNGIKTERIYGQTRFETATKIAAKVSTAPSEIFFVYGLNYADALSVSPVAALKGAPIIYLQKDGNIDAATAKYLSSVKGKVKNAYVIGGENAISKPMMTKTAKALGLTEGKNIVRISGSDRYSTGIAVNNKFKSSFKTNTICVATGLNFPDALAGGVLAAKQYAPLVLADNKLNAVQTNYLGSKSVSNIIAFGGTAAVPNSLVYSISQALA